MDEIKETTFRGWTCFSKLEFENEFNDWYAQITSEGALIDVIYFEVHDWLEDYIINDEDRIGYEEDYPNRVIVILKPDGKIEIDLFLKKENKMEKIVGNPHEIKTISPEKFGSHSYTYEGTSDCAFGCGCWMGPTRSGGPKGVDPFGLCPKNPLPTAEIKSDERISICGNIWTDEVLGEVNKNLLEKFNKEFSEEEQEIIEKYLKWRRDNG